MPGFGSDSQFAIFKQNSFGTVSAASGDWYKVPFANHDFNFAYAELTDDSIQGRADEPDRVTGIAGVTGNITANVDPVVVGHFIRGVFGTNYVTTSITGGHRWAFNPATVAFDSKCTLPPVSFQIDQGEPGVNSSFLLSDCFINTWDLSLAAGQYLRSTFNIVGVDAALMTKAPAIAYPFTTSPLIWSSTSIFLGSTAITRFQDFKLSFNNNIASQDRIAGSKSHTFFFREGFRQFGRFTGTADIAQTDWLAVKNETESRLVIFTRGNSSESLTVDIPRFVFTAHPLGVSGPGIVTVSIEGRAMFHQASATICTVTLINTVATSGYY